MKSAVFSITTIIITLTLTIAIMFVSCQRPDYQICKHPPSRSNASRNFTRGWQLACSPQWTSIQKDQLFWHTFEQYDNLTGGFPYFMFTYCSSLSLQDLIAIEVKEYPYFSSCWIDQLISGEILEDGTQRLLYNFMLFKNRIVYQRWKRLIFFGETAGINQFYIYTTGEESSDYISMGEDVHKFIYFDNSTNCNRVIYVGAENPKGWLTPFPIKYLYKMFYKQHYNAQMKCIKEYEGKERAMLKSEL